MEKDVVMVNGKEMKLETYLGFLHDPKNIGNCRNCPENRDMEDGQSRRACGQWHCWVALHCNRK